YSCSVFELTDNFLRIVLPMDDDAVKRNTEKVTEQVTRLIQKILPDQLVTTTDMLELLNLRHRPTLLYDYINPSIKLDLLEMTIPEKPNSRNQRYRLTAKGIAYRNNMVKK